MPQDFTPYLRALEGNNKSILMLIAVLTVMMIGVKSSNDPRAGIQNGFWGIKFLVIIGGMIGAFFIPNGAFGNKTQAVM